MPETCAPLEQEIPTSPKDVLRTNMIHHIVHENKAYFRSQQINDPDITEEERKTIVEKILSEGDTKFLARFGKFITQEHLVYFEATPTDDEQDRYEIDYFLKDIRKSLANRQRDVKNRRYAAMQRLMDENEYFSEVEMMKREPLLYEHLIGQYMTANERNLRDAMDSDGPEFSNILLHGIDVKNTEELRRQQQLEEEAVEGSSGDEDEDEQENESDSPEKDVHKDGIINDEYYPQVPPNFRQHWGDFEDDEPSPAASTSTFTPPTRRPDASSEMKSPSKLKSKNIEPRQSYVSADEKELLREEFFGIMCSNFLQGKDEAFDYAKVDDNSDYDNIDIQNQDAEDKYFESDDEDTSRNDIERVEGPVSDAEDDELDVYMKNINQNG